MKNGKLLGLNKWAWAGVIALGVVVFWYFHTKSANAQHASTPSNADALDEGQLASDVAGQTAAALGGQPADTSAYDYLSGLLDWQTQSLQDYFSSIVGTSGAGVGGGGLGSSGSGSGGSSGGGSGGAATAEGVAAPAPADAATIADVTNGGVTPQTTTFPGGTSVGITDVNGTPYIGYTQTPAAVNSMTGAITNGIVPPISYTPGQGAPILETLFPQINTPAYSPNPNNVQNATAYAGATHRGVAI